MLDDDNRIISLTLSSPKAAGERVDAFVEVKCGLVHRLGCQYSRRVDPEYEFVIYSKETMTRPAFFPQDKACVPVLGGWHMPVIVNFQEVGAFDSIGSVAKLLKLDFLRQYQRIEQNRGFREV